MTPDKRQWLSEHSTLVRTLVRVSHEAGKSVNLQAARNVQLAKDVLMAHAQSHPMPSPTTLATQLPRPPGQAPLLSIEDDADLVKIAKMAGFTDIELAAQMAQDGARWSRVMRQFVRLARTPHREDSAEPEQVGRHKASANHHDAAPQWISNLAEQSVRMERLADEMTFSDATRVEVLASACVLSEAKASALKLLARDQHNLHLINQLHERLDNSAQTIQALTSDIERLQMQLSEAPRQPSAPHRCAATGPKTSRF